jgi:5'/3'-nucleotidase SurE
MKNILLTNDDGFYSKGITALKSELEKEHRVWIVAPDREQSAISMALTLNHPLRINQVGENVYAVNGTTADCVNIALQKILPGKPDFVVSGMNLGENLSEDIFFSGTVGGAFSGHLYGIPSLAVSLIAGLGQYQQREFEFPAGARITARVLDRLPTAARSPSRRWATSATRRTSSRGPIPAAANTTGSAPGRRITPAARGATSGRSRTATSPSASSSTI